MVSFPYYSHIFRDSYGSGMGIVWGPRGPMSLGVPENPTELWAPSYQLSYDPYKLSAMINGR